MKYLSLALVMICTMVVNLIADLNFADSSVKGQEWDSACGSIFGLTWFILIGVIILDTIDKALD